MRCAIDRATASPGRCYIATPQVTRSDPLHLRHLQKEDMSDFSYLHKAEAAAEAPELHVVTYRLTNGDVTRATYAFNGADPVSAVERKLKGTLVELDSLGSDRGGAGERFVHAQAVSAVLISPES